MSAIMNKLFKDCINNNKILLEEYKADLQISLSKEYSIDEEFMNKHLENYIINNLNLKNFKIKSKKSPQAKKTTAWIEFNNIMQKDKAGQFQNMSELKKLCSADWEGVKALPTELKKYQDIADEKNAKLKESLQVVTTETSSEKNKVKIVKKKKTVKEIDSFECSSQSSSGSSNQKPVTKAKKNFIKNPFIPQKSEEKKSSNSSNKKPNIPIIATSDKSSEDEQEVEPDEEEVEHAEEEVEPDEEEVEHDEEEEEDEDDDDDDENTSRYDE
jgi:hypothetical protein